MQTRGGFTLIELLMVVAIITILVTMVLVSVTQSREKAKVAAFKKQAQSLQAKMIELCDIMPLPNKAAITANISGGLPAGIDFSDSDITQDCGPGRTNAFVLTLRATTLSSRTCAASLTQNGITAWGGTAIGCN